jgi:hypothetical protein
MNYSDNPLSVLSDSLQALIDQCQYVQTRAIAKGDSARAERLADFINSIKMLDQLCLNNDPYSRGQVLDISYSAHNH